MPDGDTSNPLDDNTSQEIIDAAMQKAIAAVKRLYERAMTDDRSV